MYVGVIQRTRKARQWGWTTEWTDRYCNTEEFAAIVIFVNLEFEESFGILMNSHTKQFS